MSDTISKIADTEANKRLVTAIISEFHELCNSRQITIPNEYQKDCINEIVIFYEKYLKTHKQKLLTIDFYKILSWYAVLIAEKMFNFYQEKKINNDNWFKVITFAVWRMLQELEYIEKREIEKAYMEKIITMVACEITKKGNFGIGKNGLYMLMLIARMVKIHQS